LAWHSLSKLTQTKQTKRELSDLNNYTLITIKASNETMAATTEAAAAAATSQIKSSNAPKVCDKKLFLFIYLY